VQCLLGDFPQFSITARASASTLPVPSRSDETSEELGLRKTFALKIHTTSADDEPF